MFSNTLGTALIIVAGFLVSVGHFLLRLPDSFVITVGGSVLILVDLVVRLKNRDQGEWVLSAEAGGNFLLVPVWFLGAVLITLQLLIPRS
jgi:hypothetical protein